jgi:hypothetical protein
MPYVRFRGGRSPKNTKELVRYEDPSSPCREGLRAAVASSNLHIEGRGLVGEAAERAHEEFLQEHPYAGLAHNGGVCFVEDGHPLRWCDEVIPKDEYDVERDAIERANREYRTRRIEFLNAHNDPFRRALPEHEKLGWRTRVWIISQTELRHHVPYAMPENAYAYLRIQDPDGQTGRTAQLIDIYHACEGTIEDALFIGREHAELLADVLVVSGFAPAHVAGFVSTTPPTHKEGAAFELATLSGFTFNSAIGVEPEAFERIALAPGSRLALRHVRDGFNAHLPSQAFASFWNTVEVIADHIARQKGLKRTVRCEQCGAERQAGWDLKHGFEAMYADARIVPSRFDTHRSLRGKMQHGAAQSDVESQRKFQQELPSLHTTAFMAAVRSSGIRPEATSYIAGESWPVTVWNCVANGDRVDYSVLRWSGRFHSPMVPQAVSGDYGRSAMSGVKTDLQLHPLVFPPRET